MNGNNKNIRYHLIDALRGLTVISMVFYHLSYDIFMVYGKNTNFIGLKRVYIWQQSICWTFILISGFVWRWGRKNGIKHGIVVSLLGMGVTAVTVIFMPSETIWFGILTFIGSAMLIMFFIQNPLNKFPPVLGLFLFFLLFVLFKNVNLGYVGFTKELSLTVPTCFYANMVTAYLGFPFPNFFSSDYFSLFPWLFLYIFGFYLNILFENCNGNFKEIFKVKIPVLSFIGKKALLIYVLHQPLCMLGCMLVFGY